MYPPYAYYTMDIIDTVTFLHLDCKFLKIKDMALSIFDSP